MASERSDYPLSWTSIDNYFSAIASLGDFNFNDPNDHGTPQERLAAAQLGFQTAVEAIQTQTPLTYADLHQIFSTAISGFDEKQVTAMNVQNPVAITSWHAWIGHRFSTS